METIKWLHIKDVPIDGTMIIVRVGQSYEERGYYDDRKKRFKALSGGELPMHSRTACWRYIDWNKERNG